MREQCPVHVLGTGIMRIAAVVEEVCHGKIAHRDNDTALVGQAGKLVHVRLDRFLLTTKAPRLPQEDARPIQRRIRAARLLLLAVCHAAQPVQFG